jgi:cysteine synthase A
MLKALALVIPPPLLDAELYDEARGIDEQQSKRAARLLAREEGIFAGTSSGLNVVAALQLAAELGPGKTVVTVAVDTGLKYLATDIYSV